MPEKLSNKLKLDFADNPDLQEYFSRRNPGDACQFVFKGTIDEINDGGAVLSMKGIEASDVKGKDPKKKIKTDMESPAMAILGGRKKSALETSEEEAEEEV